MIDQEPEMSEASNPFNSGFPGFAGLGSLMDQMESFKRLWSSMDVPSRLVPTLDIDELDKRIADLKAVEQWLNLNLGMLRGSIQGLEIQRGTLAAVQAFGASFSVPKAPQTAPRESAPPSAPPSAQSSAQSSPPPFAPSPPPSSAAPQAAATSAKPGTSRTAGTSPDATASAMKMPGGIDPSAWWNLLQTNFQQIAQAALAGAPAAVPAPPRSKAAPSTAAASKAPPAPRAGAARAPADKGASGRTRKSGAKKSAARKAPAGR